MVIQRIFVNEHVVGGSGFDRSRLVAQPLHSGSGELTIDEEDSASTSRLSGAALPCQCGDSDNDASPRFQSILAALAN